MDTPKKEVTNDYDSEPVCYCARCYSLKIKFEEAIDADCCADCGSSDIASSTIEDWEQLYLKRYGHRYAVKSNDPRNSPIFKLPLDKLKNKVCESPLWKKFISKLYPRFPEGLGKADSIILFFDRLIKDNRLDDLRYLLIEHCKK